MKCHYEVLDVPRNVTFDELKKSYKKLALKWHPDKNLDCVEEAKEKFQLIQQAYDVLSDPQERSWYDNHRESILKGGRESKDYEDNSLNVYQYFTTTCYKGYGDDEKGFYSIFREVFNIIASEDLDAVSDSESDFDVPSFGNSTSSYDDIVHPFYSYWQSYSTRKSYAWLDHFDIRSAPNRRVVRLMEKDNKKLRDKARRERNEEVRALVCFVRKRDKRVQEHRKLLEEKAQQNTKKAKELRMRQVKERLEEIASQKETQSEWANFSNFEQELKDIESQLAADFNDKSSDVDEDNANDSLYCTACNKVFKTEKAFSNHEKSKKHQENVYLIQFISNENDDSSKADISNDDDVENDLSSFNDDDNNDDLTSDLYCETCNILCDDDDDFLIHNSSESHIKKLKEFERLQDVSSDSDIPKSNQQKNQKKKKNAYLSSINDSDDGIENGLNFINNKSSDDDSDFKLSNKKTKKKKVKDKKKMTNDDKPKEVAKDEITTQEDIEKSSIVENKCKVCESSFKSKNELFKHIKSLGHAAPLPESSAVKSSRSRRRTDGLESVWSVVVAL